MRTPTLALFVTLAITLFSQAPAAEAKKAPVDAFNVAATSAHRIESPKAMEALLWSHNATCATATSDLLKRQCEGVRDAGRASSANKTYLVETTGDAIQVVLAGDKKSVQVTFNACVACKDTGVVILGRGDHSMVGTRIEGAVFGVVTKKFAKSADAEYWSKHIASRLRAQFLIQLPTIPEGFEAGGRAGFKVEIVGHRLFDPCKGDVLLAQPSSQQAPIQKEACSAEPVRKPVIAKVAKLVDRLSASQIKKSMKVVKGQAEVCHQIYGIEGKARFKFVIGGDGSLKEYKQLGDFTGTPTGICLDKAITQVTFPKSKKQGTPITYPIVLR